jgi:hypothetical protein
MTLTAVSTDPVHWLRNGATVAMGTTLTATTSGTYAAVAQNANGCQASSDAVTVTVSPLPPPPSIMTTIDNGQATLSASTFASPVTYSWSRDGVAVGRSIDHHIDGGDLHSHDHRRQRLRSDVCALGGGTSNNTPSSVLKAIAIISPALSSERRLPHSPTRRLRLRADRVELRSFAPGRHVRPKATSSRRSVPHWLYDPWRRDPIRRWMLRWSRRWRRRLAPRVIPREPFF